MEKEKYQYGFSKEHEKEMYDEKKRIQKAQKTLSVLTDYLAQTNSHPSQQTLLDIGCSTGFMTALYGNTFKQVVGIDIDEEAVQFARLHNAQKNVTFSVRDSLDTQFDDESFDSITCTHIYEHVPDSQRMIEEIYRLLKRGGICYFAAGNRLNIIEGHYGLPFLSFLPKRLAHLYLRITRRGTYYYENHLTLWGLQRLVSSFNVIDYTTKIIEDPEKFFATDLIAPNSLNQKISLFILKHAFFLCPTYIWILIKAG
jgi:2-polyprenyl-3-methyl-5-hydroxy-6-metoxy-1,4-benzoquinol methylase